VNQPIKPKPPGRPHRGFRARVRFRAEWRKSARLLRRHREDVALLFGVAAITFSLIGTCNSLDQVALQRNSLMPQVGVSVRPSRSNPPEADAVELIVTNNGGVMNDLQVDCRSFIPMQIKLPTRRDTLLAFLPVENYFCTITKTYQARGVIARAEPAPTAQNADDAEAQARSTYQGADLSVRPGRAHHVVHLAYTDAFGKRRDRYYVVSELESWEAPARVWRRMTDSLVVRQATRRRFDLARASGANVLRWARGIVSAGRDDRGMLKRLGVVP
jgi:hypothetical protein